MLTANGKPVAILLGVDEDELEETIRQTKAQRALSRMRSKAVQRGLGKSLASVVESQIRAVRSKRKSK